MSIAIGSSLPSLPVTSVDVPEITHFNSEFVYNFFTKDELINENVTTVAAPNTVAFSRTAPRYVKLTWNKVNISSVGKPKTELTDISIEKNVSNIVDEELLSLKFFSNYQQQETSFVTQTQHYLDGLYKQLNYNQRNASLNDAYKALHESTPENLSQEFISKYLNYAHSEATSTATQPIDPATMAQMKNIVIPIANKIFGTALHEKIINDSLTHISRDLVNALGSKFEIQNSIKYYANRLNGSQYDLSLENPINTKVQDINTHNNFVFQATGYIIERYRLQDNSQVEKRIFFIENPDTIEYFDTEIRYNQRYVYNIKVITAIQTLGFDPVEKVNNVATYLISSKLIRTFTECIDKNPADPPTDFFIRWDYGLKKIVLTWNFPNDTRRHIKYFQVFRRKNIGAIRPAQLPFELVQMYDFNDLQQAEGTYFSREGNNFVFLNGEDSIDNIIVSNINSVSNLSSMTPTCFIDEEFNREDYYIYSVAAIDAHGITTNYSNQIGIKFNKQRNTIDRVDVSGPGAPKPYPNLYLNKDTFVDTIKNEGYSQVTVVFNPEYFSLKAQTGEDLKLLNFGPDNFYRLQLINTDLQSDQFIDIKITDNRSQI
jgi:hypothetical protein